MRTPDEQGFAPNDEFRFAAQAGLFEQRLGDADPLGIADPNGARFRRNRLQMFTR